MNKLFLSAVLLCLALPATRVLAQDDAARAVVMQAATAMGGIERIRALHGLRLRGYGHEAYQDGGSEVTTEPEAPEKMTNLTAYQREIDLDNGRTLVRARAFRAFVFAAEAMMRGNPLAQALDGNIAFDFAANGAARRQSDVVAQRRRMELLAIPVVAVRSALDSSSRINNRRSEAGLELVDVETAGGDFFTLAVDPRDGLPQWLRWVQPHENLGEITLRAEYSAWVPVGGVQLPMSYNTVSDFRDTVMLRLHVDRYELDPALPDLAAPAALRNTPAPQQVFNVVVTEVAPGVTLLGGAVANGILLEFSDHLTLFEAPTSRGWGQALIDKARELVPAKPLTQVVISHHHFDHTGGLRSAVAEGLTLITQSGNLDWFEKLFARPVTHYPDALSRNPQPVKLLGVDDHLRLSDEALTVDLFRMIANGHMAHGLMAWVPEHKLLIQGDLFDKSWEVYFWGDTYEANVAYRKLDVERDVPVHGSVSTIDEVRATIAEQTRNAAALCARVEEAGLSMPGCPLAWD